MWANLQAVFCLISYSRRKTKCQSHQSNDDFALDNAAWFDEATQTRKIQQRCKNAKWHPSFWTNQTLTWYVPIKRSVVVQLRYWRKNEKHLHGCYMESLWADCTGTLMTPNRDSVKKQAVNSKLFTAAPPRPDIYQETGSYDFPQTWWNTHRQTHTLTWVSENLFSLSYVYELLLSRLLLLWILKIVWMPLLCQFPVGFDNLLFLGSPVIMERVLSAHLLKIRAACLLIFDISWP